MEHHVNSLANLQALVNIFANGCEVLGVAAGGPLLFLSWLPSVCGLRGYSLKLVGLALVMIVLGLATPVIGNMLANSMGQIGILFALVLGGISCIAMLALLIISAFAPAVIANIEGLERKTMILILTVVGIVIPVLWIVAFIFCGVDYKKKLNSLERVTE